MTVFGIIAGLGLVTAVAAASAFAPQRLLRTPKEANSSRGRAARLMAICGVTGMVVLAVSGPALGDRPAVLLALLATVLTATAIMDAAHLVIPDLHSAMVALIGLAGPLQLFESLSGALLGGGMLWLVRHLHQRMQGSEGLGLGDVKLVAALGMVVGPLHILWIIVGGAALGIAWSVVRTRGKEEAVAFGSALAAPAILVAFATLGPGSP